MHWMTKIKDCLLSIKDCLLPSEPVGQSSQLLVGCRH